MPEGYTKVDDNQKRRCLATAVSTGEQCKQHCKHNILSRFIYGHYCKDHVKLRWLPVMTLLGVFTTGATILGVYVNAVSLSEPSNSLVLESHEAMNEELKKANFENFVAIPILEKGFNRGYIRIYKDGRKNWEIVRGLAFSGIAEQTKVIEIREDPYLLKMIIPSFNYAGGFSVNSSLIIKKLAKRNEIVYKKILPHGMPEPILFGMIGFSDNPEGLVAAIGFCLPSKSILMEQLKREGCK